MSAPTFQAEMVTPTIAFSRETLAECLDDARPLIEAHWREVAPHRDIPLDPDFGAYRRLEQALALRVFTMRERTDLRGYTVFVVSPNMMYRHSLQATAVLLYLEPALRGHMIGARMIEWCDEQLAREGVQVVRHSRELSAPHSLAGTLGRLGYEEEQMVYVKRLDRPRG